LCSPPIRFLRLPLGFSADVLLAALFLCIRPPTTELYPLSLHDALPISPRGRNTSTPLCLGTTSPICTSTWCRDIRARPGNTGECGSTSGRKHRREDSGKSRNWWAG